MATNSTAAPKDRGNFVVRATLKRAGGSLTMVVPASARDALHLEEGQEMDIAVQDGKMIVAAVTSKPRYSLTELLAKCEAEAVTPDEMQAWIDAPPVGREIW